MSLYSESVNPATRSSQETLKWGMHNPPSKRNSMRTSVSRRMPPRKLCRPRKQPRLNARVLSAEFPAKLESRTAG
jgi:hypothetical protein